MRRQVPGFKFQIDSEAVHDLLVDLERVVRSGRLTLGEETRRFEEEFAGVAGVPHACAVNSGTSALEIALRIFGVQGREVLVPANTFFATAAAVVHAGGRPRFVDCDPRTLCMSYQSLVQRWTAGCAGVIAVHIAGVIVPEIDEIAALCRGRGMFLLEDAAHAHGSSQGGRPAGSFGDAAAFSFYPTKVMTSGEGGMLVTADPAVDREARIYRDQGKESFASNFHVRMGHNWRMSELNAVLGRSQLRELSRKVKDRRQIAAWFDDRLRAIPGLTPQARGPRSESNYYKYPVILPNGIDRDTFKRQLNENSGVALSGEVYQLPLHRQPVFQPYADTDLPGADEACRRHVCLPLYPGLPASDVDYVVEALEARLAAEAVVA